MKEPDAHGEHDVESPLTEIERFQPGDEELRRPGLDETSRSPRRGVDHLRRAVDGRGLPAVKQLTDERRRDSMPDPISSTRLSGSIPSPSTTARNRSLTSP